MRCFFVVAVVLFLLLTACEQAALLATPTPRHKRRVDIGDAVIVYRRSGGFAGISEQWRIYPDGKIVNGDGRGFRVPEERVKELLLTIEALGFFEMPDSLGPLDACCDRFIHEITVRRGDEVKKVATVDADPMLPPSCGIS